MTEKKMMTERPRLEQTISSRGQCYSLLGIEYTSSLGKAEAVVSKIFP